MADELSLSLGSNLSFAANAVGDCEGVETGGCEDCERDEYGTCDGSEGWD